MRSKALIINVSDKSFRIEDVDHEDIIGVVDYAIHCHLEKYESYKYPIYDEHNVIVFGMGKLAGGVLQGTHRLVFAFRSPLTLGLFTSTMGGAAYTFKYVGVDFVVIEGKAQKPTIVEIRGDKDGVKVSFLELSHEELFRIYKGYKGEEGTYALAEFILEKVRDHYKVDEKYMNFRILVVGPAAYNTNYGAIFSVNTRNGEFDIGSEDIAARGGGGSVLARAHNVAGIVFGGINDWRTFPGKLNLKSLKDVNNFFIKELGKPYIKATFDATKKYRETGTFGGNWPKLKDRSLMFNWNMIYLDERTRMELYKKLIMHERYYESFVKEVLETKSFKTCGEPCVAVCKKVRKGKYKMDYEPYSACVTLAGIFDIDEANRVVHKVDQMGFDAIGFGNTLSWVMELLYRGLLKPEEVKADKTPKFTHENFDPIKDSKHNADIAVKIIEAVAYGETEIARIIGEGIRRASKKLDEIFKDRVEKSKVKFEDLAVYAPFGKDGAVTPCQYWDLGFLAPLPFQCKFMTRYGARFMEPEDFAKECVERMMAEMALENNGICRFHRGVYEKVLGKLLSLAYGEEIDIVEKTRKLIRRIIEYNEKAGSTPIIWESKKTRDVVAYLIRDEALKGNKVAQKWLKLLENNGEKAIEEYWTKLKNEVYKLLLS